MAIADPDQAKEAIAVEADASAAPLTSAVPPGRRRFSTFDALQLRDFRYIFFGNLMQFAGMQMMTLVKGILVFQLTGSFAALGTLALANSVPGLICYPFGGVIADRFPKRSVIQVGQAVIAISTAVLAVIAGLDLLRYEHLMLAAVLQGSTHALATPSRHTIISDSVGPDRMMNAIALNTSGTNFMQLVGPGLGGLLLAIVSPAAAFWVMTGLAVGACVCAAGLPKYPPFAPARTAAGAAKPTVQQSLRSLGEGATHLIHNPALRTLISVNFVIVLLSMPYSMMLPGFVEDVLGKGEIEQGILVSVSGLGAMLGSLVIASMPARHRGQMLVWVAIALSVNLIVFATSTNYYVTIPIMLVLGVISAMRLSLGQVLVQVYSEPEYRGRVVSVWMMQYSIMSLGTFVVGMLAEFFGVQMAIGGMAVVLLVVMLVVSVFGKPIRNLE